MAFSINRVCNRCKEAKPINEFYNKPDGLHGKAAICKECAKAESRKRYNTPAYRQWHREHTRDKREQMNKYRKRYRELHPDIKDPEKIAARKIGTSLPHPDVCEICDAPGPVHAHHTDYTDHTLVVFVCIRCHGQLHTQ